MLQQAAVYDREDPMAEQRSPYPPIPEQPVQEGARWRHHRPASEAVAKWFETQPLDDDMLHEHYVGGVVIIPQSEKVKYSKLDGTGTVERYEMVFTPYMQIGTRVAYARRLAEQRELIYHTEAEKVPRTTNTASSYFNGNMPDGLWWHVVADANGKAVRFLCATTRVSFYDPTTYAAKLRGEEPMPVLTGTGTKQVGGGADINGIAKAQTGALGRALGVAGILVIGTGIATADDMQEYVGQPAGTPQLPPDALAEGEAPPAEAQTLDGLRARAMALQAQLQELPGADAEDSAWKTFVAWWQERATEEGWANLNAVPEDALKGVISKMERLHAEATA